MERPEYEPHETYQRRQRQRWAMLLLGFSWAFAASAIAAFVIVHWPTIWTGSGVFFVVVMVILAFTLPPRFDPAIRLKEWLERQRRR